MRLMTRLARWSEWLDVQLTLAEIETTGAKEQLDQVKNIALLGGNGESYDSVTEAKAAAAQDPEVIEWTSKYHQADARRRLLKNMHDGLRERSFVVSRELTRRTERAPMERREGRWGGA